MSEARHDAHLLLGSRAVGQPEIDQIGQHLLPGRNATLPLSKANLHRRITADGRPRVDQFARDFSPGQGGTAPFTEVELRLVKAADVADVPATHPYEDLARRLGLTQELAHALIEENEAWAQLVSEAVNRGQYVIVPRTDDHDGYSWEDVEAKAAREEEAIARDGWAEVARRERRTFGRPRLRTLLRLASSRGLPVATARPRPRGTTRRPGRAGGARRTSRGSPSSRDEDPEPEAVAAALRVGGRR